MGLASSQMGSNEQTLRMNLTEHFVVSSEIALVCFASVSIGVYFFFQAEDGIRDGTVTGVQTCALPIFRTRLRDRTAGRRPGQSGHRIVYGRGVRPDQPRFRARGAPRPDDRRRPGGHQRRLSALLAEQRSADQQGRRGGQHRVVRLGRPIARAAYAFLTASAPTTPKPTRRTSAAPIST